MAVVPASRPLCTSSKNDLNPAPPLGGLFGGRLCGGRGRCLVDQLVEQGAQGQQPFAACRVGMHPERLWESQVVVAQLFDEAGGAVEHPQKRVEGAFPGSGWPPARLGRG